MEGEIADPRLLVTGTHNKQGRVPGLFDVDSWQETLSKWASQAGLGEVGSGRYNAAALRPCQPCTPWASVFMTPLEQMASRLFDESEVYSLWGAPTPWVATHWPSERQATPLDFV